MSNETERVYAGLVLSELPGNQSRKNVTIVDNQVLKMGDVVGKITASGKYAIYANGASDGTQAAAGVLIGENVDATDGDKAGVILFQGAEVNKDLLGWGANDATGITNGVADLEALTPPILVRDGV
jgi:hypothetical protein